jgi:hypothetical protein
MSKRWTSKDVAKKGLKVANEPKTLPKAHKQPKKPSKEKTLLKLHLTAWCAKNGFKLVEELKFSKERRFRFDFAVEEIKVGIEYNGIMSEKSRHTSITGYSKDMDKLNLAQLEGWKVLQYTPLNLKELINDLNKLI